MNFIQLTLNQKEVRRVKATLILSFLVAIFVYSLSLFFFEFIPDLNLQVATNPLNGISPTLGVITFIFSFVTFWKGNR